MSLEENKAIIRKGIKAVNKRNLAIVDELIAPDFVDNFLQVRSLESFKEFLTELFKGFPDLHACMDAFLLSISDFTSILGLFSTLLSNIQNDNKFVEE